MTRLTTYLLDTKLTRMAITLYRPFLPNWHRADKVAVVQMGAVVSGIHIIDFELISVYRNSLIDFMDEPATAPAPIGPRSATSELADIFGPGASSSSPPVMPQAQGQAQHDPRANIMAAFSSPPPGASGAIALPGTPTPSQQQPVQVQNPGQWNAAQAAIWGPAAQTQPKATQWHQAGVVWGQTSTVGTAQPVGTTSPGPRAWGGMPSSPPPSSQPQPQYQAQQPQQQTQKKDPFADLEGLF
jgi:hypothetical protein